jgi:hypothetical protein
MKNNFGKISSNIDKLLNFNILLIKAFLSLIYIFEQYLIIENNEDI